MIMQFIFLLTDPACWDINRKSKCYHADPNCQEDEMRLNFTFFCNIMYLCYSGFF